MLKRELKFTSYLLPVMMMSFLPLIGIADTGSTPPPQQVDVTKLLSQLTPGASVTLSIGGQNIPITVGAPTAAAAQPAPAQPQQPGTPANVTTTVAPEIAGMLNAEDLSNVPNLGIKVDGNHYPAHATLEGYVARDCAADIEIYTSDNPFPLLNSTDASGVKTVGFAIHNNGQFLACMKKPENNCTISRDCVSLSSKTTPYTIDGSEHIKLAYLNDKSGNVQPASNVKVIGISDWPSVAEANKTDADKRHAAQAELAKKRSETEKANFSVISKCAEKAQNQDALDEIMELATTTNLSVEDITKMDSIKEKREKDFEKAKVAAVETDIKKLLVASKSGDLAIKTKGKRKKDDDDDADSDELVDRIKKIEDKVYEASDTLGDLKKAGNIEDDEYEKQETILATAISNLIKLRVSDDPSKEAFEDARQMLDTALGDGDDDDKSGLNPSKKAVKLLEAMRPELARAEIAVEVKQCIEDSRGLGNVNSATRDCKEANSDYTKLMKKLTAETTKCSKAKSLSKDEKADCAEESKDLESLEEIPAYEANTVNTEYQTAVANLQKARQGGQTGIAGLGQQQMGSAFQFPGSPSTPTFANGGVQVVGAGNAFGVNQLAYGPQVNTMTAGLPYQTSVNPLLPTYGQTYNGYMMRSM